MGLVENILKGDMKSAARLISQVEEGRDEAYVALSRLIPHTGKAHILGITGPAGSGKSTLTGRLAVSFSDLGRKVGVIATDPTSIKGGGAFLGDRLRMKDAEKKDIFIRSMAHRGHPGGVARAAAGAMYILEALGKDIIILESAGAGQGEKGLFYMCDTVVALFTPEYGDEFQLMKAGLLEIGDIIVVNKADKPGAEDAGRELKTLSSGRGWSNSWTVPVLLVRADRGEGIEPLVEAVKSHWDSLAENGKREKLRREKAEVFLMTLLKEELWKRFSERLRESTFCTGILDEACSGKTDPYSAILRILDRMEIREGNTRGKR
jgi:LAO/AO transport system kinase